MLCDINFSQRFISYYPLVDNTVIILENVIDGPSSNPGWGSLRSVNPNTGVNGMDSSGLLPNIE